MDLRRDEDFCGVGRNLLCHPGAFHSCKVWEMSMNHRGWTAFARTCFPNLEAGFEEAFGSLEELIEFMIDEEG